MGKTGFGGFPSCSLNVEKSALTETGRGGKPRQPAIAGGCTCRLILLRLFFMTGFFSGRVLFSFFLLTACCASGQSWAFELEAPVTWPQHSPEELRGSKAIDTTTPLLILDDHTRFCFLRLNDRRLFRTVLVQVNNSSGQRAIGTFALPESFDPVYDQHRFSRGMQTGV